MSTRMYTDWSRIYIDEIPNDPGRKDWSGFLTLETTPQFDLLNQAVDNAYMSLARDWAEEFKLYYNYKPTLMSKAITFLRNLTKSADQKLLERHGMVDEAGNPTAEGYDLADEFNFQDQLSRIVEHCKAMDAAENEKKACCKK